MQVNPLGLTRTVLANLVARDVGAWQRLLAFALFLHVALALPILNHLVTGCDPGWWSYLSFDLLHGRPLLSNQRVEQLIDARDAATYVFFSYDLRCNLFWDVLLAAVMAVFGEGYWSPHLFVLAVSVAFVVTNYAIVAELFADRVLAAQVGLLLVLDYQVFWTGTMTRPGMAATTFACLGVYLLLRWLRSGRSGWMAGATLAWVAAFTTHPLTFVLFASALFVAAGTVVARHRRDFRALLARGWPIVIAGVLLLVFMYQWSKAFGLVDLTEERSQTFNLWYAMVAEFKAKFWQLHVRRFALPVLLVALASVALVAWRCWRQRDTTLAAVLAMTGLVFLLSAVFDSTNFDERLLYYSPMIAVCVAVAIGAVFERAQRTGTRLAIVAALVAAMLVPRAGKYYQILRNWRHTDYMAYVDFVKTHVPPGSVVVADVRLVWGLQGYGLKVLQTEEFKDGSKRAFTRRVVEKIDYLLIDDSPLGFPAWMPRDRFYANLNARRLSKVAEFRGKPGYGYDSDLIRVQFTD